MPRNLSIFHLPFSPPHVQYYNSDLSIWISVDPLSDKYPNLSPYTYCAGNPVKFFDEDGRDFFDDIVIHGSNNSSITIKTNLINWDVTVDRDLGGNFSLNPDNVVVGYEYGIDAFGGACIGTSYTAYKQSVMFLGGAYAGYWYDYIGGKAQIDVSTSAEGAIGGHRNYFIAINNNPATYNPKDFSGKYHGASLSVSLKVLAGLSVDGQLATSKDKSWTAISLGESASIGVQVGFIAGFDVSFGAHLGETKLLSEPKSTKQRSLFDIESNWLHHLFY